MALEWARLLQQQQDDGRLGLTPSFLVGALRGLPGNLLGTDSGLPAVRALVTMMRDEQAPSGKVVSIFECQNIVQPVAALSSANAQGDSIRSTAGGLPRLFVWPWVPSERPVDFEWLIQAIWIRFGHAIATGNFSYDRRTKRFGPFNEGDIAFIERALTESDEK